MAIGIAKTSEGFQYNARITWFLVLSCTVAATGGLIFGYDIGISGGVTSMDHFLKKFFPEEHNKMKKDSKTSNYCKFDSQLLTSFTSSLYLAGLVASLCASPVTRAFGCKSSILLGGVAFLAGSALGGAAYNVIMLIFDRLFLGFGIGFANQSVPLYLSEMAPPKNRGAIGAGFNFCVGIGVLLANLINYGTEKIRGGWGWRLSLVMAAAPASILTMGALFLPDTPNSLIQHGKSHKKAKRVLQQVHGESASLMSAVVTGVVGSGAIFLTLLIVDKIGRRVLFIIGGGLMLICQLLIGTLVALKLGDQGKSSNANAYLVLLLICIYVAGFGLSWGPLGWLVPSEIFPLEIRSAAQSIRVAVDFVFIFLIAQSFLAMLCHFMAGIFFFFGGWVIMMTAFVYLLLPETKNVPIEKMDRIWREHWFWKAFVLNDED
ncbi:hypothetical protein ACH5RR_016970 [Cinchona calisaya]|uniref:Major facilitator superfamily (MFS) profile domain-containing protein n=1 Tax=Cinchona calisaya TaxID=153742 RepID=A0ABD2ZXG4_9GENT